MKKALIICALVAVVGLPFLLRPKQPALDAADDTLIIITPHNEAIRYEYAQGFREWYRRKTGRTVSVDWRVIGGTGEINRFIESEYTASFRNYWVNTLQREWSTEVLRAYANPRVTLAAAPAADSPAQAARRAFLGSEVSCGLDLFFGGGSIDYIKHAEAGRLLDSGILRLHPEWFGDGVIPQSFTGEPYWDAQGRWVGDVLSSYGIIFNRDVLRKLGLAEPRAWTDLQDPRYRGQVALCDPTKSSSTAKAFDNLIQQQIYLQWDRLAADGGDRAALEPQAVREGWERGLRLVQRIGANARYFTDTSQKTPIDVTQGNAAAGMCIDFYGRDRANAPGLDGRPRVGYFSPVGGTVLSPDPLAVLRGAPHRAGAAAFIEYALSMEGQLLWNYRLGAPGGPKHYELRRMPIRRDFYTAGHRAFRTDPDDAPYDAPQPLVYRPEWTSAL
ncbi:MAG: extracellular solute-binding protein, partial [Opitutae bacterium]|nr:extracellular solute-binding protein [Opitutae bacterium]